MSILEKFLAGSGALFGDPFTIAIFVFGVIGGMLFGAIPGVSMLTLAAILLPFTADLGTGAGRDAVRGDLLHRHLWRRDHGDPVQHPRRARKTPLPPLTVTR